MKNITTSDPSAELLHNVIAGLIVSFVALSLGASLGILSGRGAFAGMLSAGVIALITSLFGGTRIQCSGPTAPMSAVSAVVIAYAFGALAEQAPGVNPDHFITIVFVLMAGLLALMALCRLGRFITWVPNVVISGFMSGIALLIWFDQTCKLLGWGGKTALTGSLWLNLLTAGVTLALIFLLPSLLKRLLPKIAHLLPATLLTIILVSMLAHLLALDVEFVSLSLQIDSFGDFMSFVAAQFPTDWSRQVVWLALPFALQLAVLCYLDTLLTSLVIDKITHTRTRQNQELLAQGLANASAGLLGGIPGAQATIRSVLIIKEGATLRLAGVLVGVFVLIEMILFQNLINLIPQAVFTGILLKVGYDVFDWLPLRLYAREWYRQRNAMLHRLLSRQDDAPILVTHREMALISGTALVTMLYDLNVAVFAFTALFYILNKWLTADNPMRDLKPVSETRVLYGDD